MLEGALALAAAASVLFQRRSRQIWFVFWWATMSLRMAIETHAAASLSVEETWEWWSAPNLLYIFMVLDLSGLVPFVLVLLGIGAGVMLVRGERQVVPARIAVVSFAAAMSIYALAVVIRRTGTSVSGPASEILIWGSLLVLSLVMPLLLQRWHTRGASMVELGAAATFAFGLGSTMCGGSFTRGAAQLLALIVVATVLQLGFAGFVASLRQRPLSWRMSIGCLVVGVAAFLATRYFLVAAYLI